MDFPNDDKSHPQNIAGVVRTNCPNDSNDYQLSPKTLDNATGMNMLQIPPHNILVKA